MFRLLLAGIALAIGAGSVRTATPSPIPSFSLVLESSTTGWAARCESGCAWQRLSFGCERACAAIIDANGVATVGAQRLDSAAFRFRAERTPSGIRATSKGGTAWEKLGWSCRLNPCRARIDASGVSELDRIR